VSQDCWKRIGVRGDRSCPELERHVHCRNCEVYAAAARALLDRPLDAADLIERTRQVATAKSDVDETTEPVVIFRIAAEWFALPMAIVAEVAALRSIHSLPHRGDGPVRGVANVRGELLTCVSLGRLLGMTAVPEPPPQRGAVAYRRLLVLKRGEMRLVCPASDVHGVYRARAAEFQDVPLTVGRAVGRLSKAVLNWRGLSVGVLDDELVFHAIQRSLA